MNRRKLLALFLVLAVLLTAVIPVQAFPPGPMRGPWSRQAFQRELLRIGGDNLVAYWPLDDQSGTRARDLLERLGAELVTNGTFDSDLTGWTQSNLETFEWLSGEMHIVETGTNFSSAYQNSVFTKGKLYKISFKLTKNSGANLIVQEGDNTTIFTYTSSTEQTLYYVSRVGGAIRFKLSGAAADWLVDDVSVKEVTRGEYLDIIGTTLGQNGPPQLGRSHYFDGINDVDSQHPYEDETGASWGPTVHGFSLVDGNAFLRVEGVDLSTFAGDGSTTPYMIVVTDDAASKVAWGYLYTQEAAEGLGGELLSNVEFTTNFVGWAADNSVISRVDSEVDPGANSGGVDKWSMKVVDAGAGADANQSLSTTVGKLYKISCRYYSPSANTSNNARMLIRNTDGLGAIIATIPLSTEDGWTYGEGYFTAEVTTSRFELAPSSTTGDIAYFDSVSIKEVLHPGTDAVHIVSTKDGSTRNWAGIDGSFDYNDSAYTFQIRKSLFQQTGAITVGAWVKPAAASLAESEYFIAKRASADLSWALYRNTSEQYSTFVSLSGASTASSIVGTPHVDTDWRFVMFTFEPSVALILYVNGSAEASDTIGIPASLFDSSAPLTVGDYSELVRTWQGNIAHAFVMDKALDARAVKRLYDIGARAHGG